MKPDRTVELLKCVFCYFRAQVRLTFHDQIHCCYLLASGSWLLAPGSVSLSRGIGKGLKVGVEDAITVLHISFCFSSLSWSVCGLFDRATPMSKLLTIVHT